MVVSGAIAAAFALPGCAPAGYNAADYGAGAAPAAEPAANAVEATPTPDAEDGTDEKPAAPELSEKELTNELNAVSVKRMGETVQDEGGWILYRFDDDKIDPSKSNCNGDCAKIWPPALTDGEPELDGVAADDVGTVERADGTKQLTLDGWPVYRYIGDLKAGQWKGQNVGGKWFVVQPDGKKNLSCLPKISKPVKLPGNDKAEDKADDKAEDKGTEEKGGGSAGTDYNY